MKPFVRNLGDNAEKVFRGLRAKFYALNHRSQTGTRRRLTHMDPLVEAHMMEAARRMVRVWVPRFRIVVAKLSAKAYFSGSQELRCLLNGSLHEDDGPRNNHWMETISSQVDNDEATAYIIGCDHLYRKSGILMRCAEKGWRVEHLQTIDSKYVWSKEDGNWNLSACPLLRSYCSELRLVDTSGLGPVNHSIEDNLDQCPYMREVPRTQVQRPEVNYGVPLTDDELKQFNK